MEEYGETEEHIYGSNPALELPDKWKHLRVETILKRDENYDYDNAPIFKDPESIRDWMIDALGLLQISDRERFFAVFLDQKHSPTGIYEVSIGTLTETMVHPRESFKAAILAGAAAVVFIHNHPSGNPEFSKADKEVLKRLNLTATIVGIRILDFIVMGVGNRFESAKLKGLL